MMYEFLISNRSDLAQRCRDKVAKRPGRSASSVQLENGVPMFLEQLIRTLQIEQTENPMDSREISGPSGGTQALSEVGASAAQHGKDLLDMGFTVDEVVHDYGDLCQSITDLAVERDAPFNIDEFRTLNRCLDNAIADAVTEFSYQERLTASENGGCTEFCVNGFSFKSAEPGLQTGWQSDLVQLSNPELASSTSC